MCACKPQYKLQKKWKTVPLASYPSPPICRSFAATVPHHDLGVYDCQILVNFAQLVTRELQREFTLRAQQAVQAVQGGQEVEQYKALRYRLELAEGPTVLVDTSQAGFPVVYANSSWADAAGGG